MVAIVFLLGPEGGSLARPPAPYCAEAEVTLCPQLPLVPEGPGAFLASRSSLAQVLFCLFDETLVTGPLLGTPALCWAPPFRY